MKKIYTVIIVLAYFISGKSSAQCLIPSLVPYYEGFQGITVNNQLPTCWAVSNSTTCLTFTTPSKYAAFYYTPAGTSYFFTNAIQLQAGVTYSMASVFKIVNLSPSNSWTEFSMLIGQNQNTAGLVNVASVFNPANASYSALTNTFIVPATGTYCATIKATSNGSGGPQYLQWDDLSIIIPCTAAYNTPNVVIAATPTSICAGDQFTLTASGADTYTWFPGGTTNPLVVTPLIFTPYNVTGTSTLTGCTSSKSISITVKPSPPVVAFASSLVVCAGSTVILTAQGAHSYTWTEGPQGQTNTVVPLISTAYTVTGTNLSGCTSTANIVIAVNPLPVITVTNISTPLCIGEPVVCSATGPGILQWNTSNGQTFTASPVTFTPSTLTSTLTVFGTDNTNCVGRAELILTVNACTGLEETNNAEAVMRIYPNPGQGEFILESANSDLRSIVISDVVGKIVFRGSGPGNRIFMDLSGLTNGIYMARVYSGNSINTFKFLKQD